MSDKQMTALLDRVAKLEAEVEHLKSGGRCKEGLLGLFGSQKDNPLFAEVIAEIEDRKRETSGFNFYDAALRNFGSRTEFQQCSEIVHWSITSCGLCG